MKRLYRAVVFAAVAVASAPSLACSCVPAVAPQAKHVFVARIVRSTLSADRQWIDATFEITETFKGNPSAVAGIKARATDPSFDLPQGVQLSCPDLPVAPGMHFVVFATDESPVVYSFCSPTQRMLKRDDPVVEALRRGTSR